MNKIILLSTLLVFICGHSANTLKYPGQSVYVVTPSPRTLQIDEGRSAPFYYHTWRRRMDPPTNTTTTSTTTTTTPKTPDLIFAEFESNSMKNIRKLLEKERAGAKTTTTSKPINVIDEDIFAESQNFNYEAPSTTTEKQVEQMASTKDMTDYFALYNNMYGSSQHLPAPAYFPPTAPSTTSPEPTSTTTTTVSPINNVENIWHIIDSEKHDQYNGQWDEVLNYENDKGTLDDKTVQDDETKTDQNKGEEDDDSVKIDDNFALPGFVTNPVNGAENESRAIRTEPNIRFPYVNLKPFQMKNPKKPLNTFANGKKGNNNMYTSLDNFFEMKNPVRGEAQDVVVPTRQPVDRYNPAQPYLPAAYYGSKAKPSSPSSTAMKAVANLVPPPPPPVPKLTANDFPSPITYESYPPYAPSAPTPGPPPPPPVSRPVSMPHPPSPPTDSSGGPPDMDDNSSGPSMDMGYQPPSPQIFLPTLPPLKKPYGGYSYNKPAMTIDTPPTMDMSDKPDFSGYHYAPPAPEKPDFHGYHYSKPEPPKESKPDYGYHYEKPAPEKPDEPHFHGYHYSKPEPSDDHPPISYDHHHGPSFFSHDDDDDIYVYPGLTFHDPHVDMDDSKGGDDMKGGGDDMKGGGDMKGGNDMKGGDDDMGMMPPPPSDMKPMDDSGFPHDFPGDFKFHFDDDFHHHHHHHTTTTTTTTTEMPRVNRYSYYYLGKKLYYLPLYFSVYFIIYVGALIIKAVLRHKIVYPNSWRPNDDTASFFSKRSVDSWDLSKESLHEMTGKVTHAIATAAEKYISKRETKNL